MPTSCHDETLQVQDEDGWIAFFPGPFANLTAGVDHMRVAPIIGNQWFTWSTTDTHYRWVETDSQLLPALTAALGRHRVLG